MMGGPGRAPIEPDWEEKQAAVGRRAAPSGPDLAATRVQEAIAVGIALAVGLGLLAALFLGWL